MAGSMISTEAHETIGALREQMRWYRRTLHLIVDTEDGATATARMRTLARNALEILEAPGNGRKGPPYPVGDETVSDFARRYIGHDPGSKHG